MKAVITGGRGTVGRALTECLRSGGHEVIHWDRRAVSIENYQAMEDFLRRERPHVLFHLAIASQPSGLENEGWLVNYHWPSELAWITGQLGIRFIFTSTVMVFTNNAKGPFRVDSHPDETEGYGGEKRRAEERVLYQNPKAIVARLGWQIGEAAGSNNMIDYLEKQMAEQGRIEASRKWLPSCSLLADTADALCRLVDMEPGLYLVNQNRDMNFFEIATGLNRRHGGRWKVEANENFVYDQRMIDERLPMPDLRGRLEAKPA